MVETVLSNSGLLPTVSNSLILDSIRQSYERRLVEQTEATSVQFQNRSAVVEEEQQQLQTMKVDAVLAESALQIALDNADEIRTLLFDLKIQVENAANDPDYYSSRFDDTLAEIFSISGSGELSGNTGRATFQNNQISYANDRFDHQTTVYGAFLGSDYYITDDATGDLFIPGFGSDSLKLYESYPNYPTGDDFSVKGLQLNSFDGTNVNFTVDAGQATEATYSGVVTRGGLGILHSFFYDLSTASGRTEAAADVQSAREQFEREVLRLESEQTRAQNAIDRFDGLIEDKRDEVFELLRESALAQFENQSGIQSDFQRTVFVLNSFASTQRNYTDFYQPFLGGNKLTGLLIDTYA